MSKAPYGHRHGHFRFGNSQIKRVGGKTWDWNDVYHWMLAMSWPRFFFVVLLLYVSTNLVFATLFWLQPGSVANARAGVFLDHFFFSVETLATVGYGFMNPATLYGHIVATCEILLGMAEVAVVAGLMFSRFARPTTRIMFSRVAVVCKFNGVPTLMVRTGNERNNLILEAEVKASIVKRETTVEGQEYTRVYDLKLERDRTSVFALSWTVMHQIDANSPLYGKDIDDLFREGVTLMVSISGIDDTFNDFVHARHTYTPEEIMWGYRFVDILSERDGDVRLINFDKFHDVIIDVAPRSHEH
ncbi:ion channel [Massilia sp. TS11]|uniref:ion channel n=1 Tax=Massilia sp. TS11 TaxID=2908003 RepID=UPI001ED9E4CA|nr:ion channel [Massilia sp. TS11]MCG2584076.1 ion channel [Massilia sp. TS11]